MSPYCSDYIIPFGWEARGDITAFARSLVVTPSVSLALSGYIYGLARYYL